MIFIDTIKFPSTETVYRAMDCYSVYPWTIFNDNLFEWLILKDITILYGSNGSGKTTVLNIIAEKIKATRTSDIFKDVVYVLRSGGSEQRIEPFNEFVHSTTCKMGIDDMGKTCIMPSNKKLIKSEDVFKSIENRLIHNNRALIEVEEAREKHKAILNKGYTFKTLEDYEDLVAYTEAIKTSSRRYSKIHSSLKEKMLSNGETALQFYSRAFEIGGIYLIDEPENCLSPIFQIELMKLIQDAVKYFNCQFIISTHSPILLSLDKALIYNLDKSPVVSEKWNELQNVKIYYEFFKSHKNEFEPNL